VPPPLTAVTEDVLLPTASTGLPEKLSDQFKLAALLWLPLRVIVSVAPVLTVSAYVVAFAEDELMVIIAPDDVALTPIVERFVSALTAEVRAAAIDVKVSPDKTVYFTTSAALSAELCTTRLTTSPAVTLPETVAFSLILITADLMGFTVVPWNLTAPPGAKLVSSFRLLYPYWVTPVFAPSVIVSVAPLLVDCPYVVVFSDVEDIFTTVETAVAVTPIPDRLASPFIADARALAMLVSVSPECTV